MKNSRILPVLAVAAALALTAVDALAQSPECTCRNGNGSYWFLNAPVSPPDDPVNCPFCEKFPGQCKRVIPRGWDPACFNNNKMECFLRRHACSWRLSCSERLKGKCGCKTAHPELCPAYAS